ASFTPSAVRRYRIRCRPGFSTVAQGGETREGTFVPPPRSILAPSGQNTHGARAVPASDCAQIARKATREEKKVMNRILVFGYGVLSYLIFLGTFLYAVGFIGGFAVPTRLDGPSRDPLGTALAVDVALLGLFAVQHSVMARSWFKKAWTRLVPEPAERSTYVLFSSLALILLF